MAHTFMWSHDLVCSSAADCYNNFVMSKYICSFITFQSLKTQKSFIISLQTSLARWINLVFFSLCVCGIYIPVWPVARMVRFLHFLFQSYFLKSIPQFLCFYIWTYYNVLGLLFYNFYSYYTLLEFSCIIEVTVLENFFYIDLWLIHSKSSFLH